MDRPTPELLLAELTEAGYALPSWCSLEQLHYAFDFDEATPSNNVIKDMHFHAYRRLRQAWKLRTFVQLGGRRPRQPLARAALVVIRWSAGHLDWDNAYGGLKPLLDCLVAPSNRNPDGLGLVADDNPEQMPFPPFMVQLPAKRNQSRTRVLIFDLGEAAAPELDSEAGLWLPPWCFQDRLRYQITLNEASPSNNVIRDMHFHTYKKLRRTFSESVLAQTGQPTTTLATSAMMVVRLSPGSLDCDKACGGLKPFFDCFVPPTDHMPDGLGLVADDNPVAMPYPPFVLQAPAKRNQGRTDCFIFEVSG